VFKIIRTLNYCFVINSVL